MHIYDYLFLDHFPLPDHLAGLLEYLHKQDDAFSRRVRREPQAYSRAETDVKTRAQEAIRRIEAVELPAYAQVWDQISEKYADTSWDADFFLHIIDTLSPTAAPLDEEKRQAISLAVSAYKAAKEHSLDPFLLAPCLALDIICTLSPRHGAHGAVLLLTRLLLGQAGSNICRYTSLEEKICRYYYFYQRALSRAQVHWAQNGSAYLPYMEMFLSLLYLCCQDLPKPSIGQRGRKRAAVEALVLSSPEPISKSEICTALPNVSPTTVEAVLGNMVKAGSIRRVGAARAARYTKP